MAYTDNLLAQHINNLKAIALKYATSQQLRAHLRTEVLRFLDEQN